jgi:ABC-2 type transport system ATP-binding protein
VQVFKAEPRPLDEPVVRADDVTKQFPDGGGVVGFDLEVPRGAIMGLVGPSGSGKTTAVRLLLGLLMPEHGSMRVMGRDPRTFSTSDRRRIGYLPQLSVLYPDLSVRQNLDFVASIYGVAWRSRFLPTRSARAARKRIDEVLRTVGLEDRQRHRLRDTSGGEQRRLALAAALAHDPELLLLDEPTAGVDPVLRQDLWHRFGELRDQGRTLIVTTQYVTEAAYCDLVAVLAEGRVLHVATPDDLQREAFGGQVLELGFSRPLLPIEVDEIGDLSGVHMVTRAGSRRSFRATVEDATAAQREVGSWAGDHDVEITTSAVVTPSFDDVFVELVERHRGRADAEEASA